MVCLPEELMTTAYVSAMILLHLEIEVVGRRINHVARRAAFIYLVCGMVVKKQPRRDATVIRLSSWTVYSSHTNPGQLFYRQQLDPFFQLPSRHS